MQASSRMVSAFRTIRTNTSQGRKLNDSAELDSHADTCCFGPGAFIVSQTGRSVTAHPFVSGLGTVKEVHICTVAVAYDCEQTHTTYVMFFHESLYFENLDSHLMCPNQVRMAGHTINYTPLLCAPEALRTAHTHSIVSQDHDLHVPLSLNGTTSKFTVHMPTQEEVLDVQQANVVHVHMTLLNGTPKLILSMIMRLL